MVKPPELVLGQAMTFLRFLILLFNFKLEPKLKGAVGRVKEEKGNYRVRVLAPRQVLHKEFMYISSSLPPRTSLCGGECYYRCCSSSSSNNNNNNNNNNKQWLRPREVKSFPSVDSQSSQNPGWCHSKFLTLLRD